MEHPSRVARAARAALSLCTILPAAVACSSGGHPAAAGTPGDAGGLVGHDANPDGVPYPSGPYGRSARRGTTPGSVLENFAFRGYPGGDPSHGLQTISLADYYDPCGKRFKLLHITVAGLWCTNCNQETDAMVAAKAQLDAAHVAVLQALDDGNAVGVPATQGDLDVWVRLHKPNFTEVLDPGLANLGGFFSNPSSIPWNFEVDPRTMELVADGVGIQSDATAGLSAIPATPGYPLAVVCN
jgi:hypothetical protein